MPFLSFKISSLHRSLSSFLPFCWLVLILVLLLCHTWTGPDIWYHLTWGRSIVKTLDLIPSSRPLILQPVEVNNYWVYQIFNYLVFDRGGAYLVSVLYTLIWVSTTILWLKIINAHKSPILGSFIFFVYIVCTQMRFDHRPEVFSYFFLTSIILILCSIDFAQRIPVWKLCSLIMIQILWSNCHSYFFLGPLVAIALICSFIIEGRTKSNLPYLNGSIILVVLLSGSIFSPFGWYNWWSVFSYSKIVVELNRYIGEFYPTYKFTMWPLWFFWFYWVLVVLCAISSLLRREKTFAALLALGGNIASFESFRNIPLFIILSSPLTHAMSSSIKTYFFELNSSLKKTLNLWNSILWTIGSLLLSVSIIRGDYYNSIRSAGGFGVRLDWAAYPIGVVEFLKSIYFQGTVFSDSYDGGYLEYYLPQIKVTGDSYFSDTDKTIRYLNASLSLEALQLLDDEFQFDALVINWRSFQFLTELLSNSHWVLSYSDSHRVVFLNSQKFIQYNTTLASGNYYHGEDLKHWIYRQTPIFWINFANQRKDVALLTKVLQDVSRAKKVPSELVTLGNQYADAYRDSQIREIVKKLQTKMF